MAKNDSSGTGSEVNKGAEEVLSQEEEEIELLSAVALLDLEAALAYELVAQNSEVPALSQKLHEFAADHFRHADDLNRLIRARGGTPLDKEAAPSGLLAAVATMSIPLGPLAQVSTLLTNEQLTNGTYDLALAYEWDDDVEAVLDGNLSDEQRHLGWLADEEDRLSAAGDEEHPAPANA